MWHEGQLWVENEAQNVGFLNYIYGIPIKGQFQFHMHAMEQEEVHADCFGLGQFESIQNQPSMNPIYA